MGSIHTALDIFRFIPVIGDVLDGVNAGLYAIEGDYLNALLSAGAIVPIVGSAMSKGGKYAFKILMDIGVLYF